VAGKLPPLTLCATLVDILLTFRHIGCDSPVECSYYLSVIAVHARSEPKAPLTSTKSGLPTSILNNKLPLSSDPRDVTITYPEPDWPWTPISVVAGPSTTLYARHGSASTSIPKPDVKPASVSECQPERTGIATCNFSSLECTDCKMFPWLCSVRILFIIFGPSTEADPSS
jgi:hypothetical protein